MALCLCLLVILGARPGSAQPLPERRVVTVHAIMTDGKPAAGLTFVIYRVSKDAVAQSWSWDGITDARGELTVPNMEDGAYRLRILETNHGVTEIPGDFIADASTTLWTVSIAARAGLRILVLGPDGIPEAKKICYCAYVCTLPGQDVPVVLRRKKNTFGGVANSAPPGMAAFALRADENGILPIESLPVGTYSDFELFVPSDGYVQVTTPYDLTTSGVRDVTLKLERGGALRVHVLEGTPQAPGRPLGQYSLLLEDCTATDETKANLAEHLFGRYGNLSVDGIGQILQPDLVPGSYTLRLTGVAADQINGPDAQTVQVVDGTTAEATFYLKPREASELILNLTDFNDRPLANVNFDIRMQLPPPPTPPAVPNAPKVPRQKPQFENRVVRTDDTGKVVIYPLKAGHYDLTVNAMNDNLSEVGQGRVGSGEADTDPKTPGTIDITLDGFIVSATQ